MTETNSNAKIVKTVSQLVKNISSRNKDIITRRFGLKTGKKETLESIGKSYGITRERVRQIEEFTFGQLAKSFQEQPEVKNYVSQAKDILAEHGGIMKEKDLFKSFSGTDKETVANASLVFVLTLARDIVRCNENNNYHTFWALDDRYAGQFRSAVGQLVSVLEKNKRPLPEKEIHQFAKDNKVNDPDGSFSESYINTVLAISKSIDTNIFREVGLSEWAEVRPRGVRDKAYLVLKKENKPKHFSEIARMINNVNFSAKKANVQTVHNELIKDKRFVLVGRGTYALSEWGYRPGTVKDVLIDILKSSGPLPKAELVVKTMGARMVKENTILLNLQDSKVFHKQDDGTYVLRKA